MTRATGNDTGYVKQKRGSDKLVTMDVCGEAIKLGQRDALEREAQ